MMKRMWVCALISIFMVPGMYGCAKKDVVVQSVVVPAPPLDQAPIAVRAAEKREQKVYNFKQHYMEQEGTSAEGASSSSNLTEPKKTVKPRIAVARFGDTKNLAANPFSGNIGDTTIDRATNTIITENRDKEPYVGFTEDIITALVELDKFIVVERKDVTKMLREQGFQASAFAEDVTNKDFGSITGISHVITGTVGIDENNKVAVNLRVYDAFRGTIVTAKRIVAETRWDAVNEAVTRIAEQIVPQEFKLKISSVDGQTVYVNGGPEEGLRNGDKYEVFSVGAPIVDPDTNQVLGRQEERIALIEIGGAQTGYSSGTIIEQTRPIKIGDVVRSYKGIYFDGDTSNEAGFLKATKEGPVDRMAQTDVSAYVPAAQQSALLPGVQQPTNVAGLQPNVMATTAAQDPQAQVTDSLNRITQTANAVNQMVTTMQQQAAGMSTDSVTMTSGVAMDANYAMTSQMNQTTQAVTAAAQNIASLFADD
ncbi:MAG: hypothetical protein JW938_00505 [Candidatus Omnitrophica bacterium]|nr:hypothetical protein [Candidatus Omnitrophota bacterium]